MREGKGRRQMYDRLPEEIRQLNQWICVKNTSKIPFVATEGRAASATDPETWRSYTDAVDAVSGRWYDGIGFVFADNGIVGIDIDKGFDEYGLLTPLAADIMNRCQSYTEKSRSGRGIHILIKGRLPFDGRNNLDGVEIYQTKRYFICTGNVLIFDVLSENQYAVDKIIEKYFTSVNKGNTERTEGKRIYNPMWQMDEKGKIPLKPQYPPIGEGGRHISLVSLAGQLWSRGLSAEQMQMELLTVNMNVCKPPLPEKEVKAIVKSVTRYRRE